MFLKELPSFWKTQKIPRLCYNCGYIKLKLIGMMGRVWKWKQGRSYYDNNMNISHCFFSRSLTYYGDGGVIYVNDGSYSMNFNYSMFYYCSQNGEAIYISSSISCLRMLCANRCSASQFHFAYLNASMMNQVQYISVWNCSHTTSGDFSIYLSSGSQMVEDTNSSMNNAIWGSGIVFESPSFFTCSHCTFSNNKVSGYICIRFYSTSGTI